MKHGQKYATIEELREVTRILLGFEGRLERIERAVRHLEHLLHRKPVVMTPGNLIITVKE